MRREIADRNDHRGGAAAATPSRRSARPGSATRRPRPSSIGYVVEEGPRVYIERDQRPRQHPHAGLRDPPRVRSRAKGDAYNKVLIDRAERRLNKLGYFKKVRISNEPGSAPDRVVVNIDVEDQPTGPSRSRAATPRRTASSARSRSASPTSWAAASTSNALRSLGEYAQGVDFSFTEPYFLGYRLAAGYRPVLQVQRPTQVRPLREPDDGRPASPRLPITEEIGITPRYALYQSEPKIPNTIKKPVPMICTLPIAGTRALNA